jgi:hypothetical protein
MGTACVLVYSIAGVSVCESEYSANYPSLASDYLVDGFGLEGGTPPSTDWSLITDDWTDEGFVNVAECF